MGEVPITTLAGAVRFRQRLNRLEERLATLRREKGEAAEVGGDDWHDNAAFEHLEREERMLMRQIAELKRHLDLAQVANQRAVPGEVAIGSTVVVRFDDGEIMTLTIGGDGEGDPEQGVIAHNSPLGRSLQGAQQGERRSYRVGGTTYWVELDEVRDGSADEV